jgi:hypothetical protein
MSATTFVDVADSEHEEMTLTREEVMRARYHDINQTMGDASAPPQQNDDSIADIEQQPPKAKRVVRKYDEGWRANRPRKPRTSSKVINMAATESTTALPEPQPVQQVPQSRNVTTDSSRLVSVVQQLTAAGLQVGMEVDGIAIAVHA